MWQHKEVSIIRGENLKHKVNSVVFWGHIKFKRDLKPGQILPYKPVFFPSPFVTVLFSESSHWVHRKEVDLRRKWKYQTNNPSPKVPWKISAQIICILVCLLGNCFSWRKPCLELPATKSLFSFCLLCISLLSWILSLLTYILSACFPLNYPALQKKSDQKMLNHTAYFHQHWVLHFTGKCQVSPLPAPWIPPYWPSLPPLMS